MSDPAVVLRNLELTVTRKLDGLLHGRHEGLTSGQGSEPGDARLYRPGDDVRFLDWAVTARTNEPHVRVPIAERELETWVVADLSPSLAFGTASCEKRDLAIAATAAIGYLTSDSGNRFGAVLVAGSGTTTLPPRGGRQHLQAVLRRSLAIGDREGGGPTDLAGAIGVADRIAHRRGLVAVVSDFLAPAGWERPLRVLAARHEVVAVEVVDPRELTLPDVGVLTFEDPETGARLEVQTSDAALRRRYAEAAAAQRATIARTLQATGVDHLQLRTDRDWLADIVRFVDRRRRRRGHAAPRPSGMATA